MSEVSSPVERPKQRPSVGRVVHYVLPSGVPRRGEVRPATITRVWEDRYEGDTPGMCNLNVQLDQDSDMPPKVDADTCRVGSVLYDASGAPGTWHWPPVVPTLDSTAGISPTR